MSHFVFNGTLSQEICSCFLLFLSLDHCFIGTVARHFEDMEHLFILIKFLGRTLVIKQLVIDLVMVNFNGIIHLFHL